MIRAQFGPPEESIAVNIKGINSTLQIVSITTEENYMGSIPKAELIVKYQNEDGSGKGIGVKLLDELDLTITNHQGYSIKAPMYVYAIDSQNSTASIKLMSYNCSFIRDIHCSKYTNIKNAIKSLTPNNVKFDSNTETNLLDDIPIHQIMQSDYNFLSRLLRCYKIDTIFSFNLNGIKLNDLKNYKVKDKDFVVRGNVDEISIPEITSPKLYDLECEYVDYSSTEDPNHTYLKMGKYWYPVNNEYKEVGFNYIHNLRLDSTPAVINIKCPTLRDIEVTDGVKFKDEIKVDGNNNYEVPSNKLFISSRTIMLTYQKVEVDYTVRTIEKV